MIVCARAAWHSDTEAHCARAFFAGVTKSWEKAYQFDDPVSLESSLQTLRWSRAFYYYNSSR